MNRRSLLSILASLPALGWLKPADPVDQVVPPMKNHCFTYRAPTHAERAVQSASMGNTVLYVSDGDDFHDLKFSNGGIVRRMRPDSERHRGGRYFEIYLDEQVAVTLDMIHSMTHCCERLYLPNGSIV